MIVAALTALFSSASRAQSGIPSPVELLSRYVRGDGAGAAALIAGVPDDKLEALGKSVQRASQAWLQTIDPLEARRRRLAAATFTLDLAHAGLHTQWRVLRPLIEWGCGLVRQNPPGDSEHDWHRAAIALAGGARDPSFLIDPPISRGMDRVYKHVNHSADQFPDDPRWKLVRAMAVEFPGMSEGVRNVTVPMNWSGNAGTLASSPDWMLQVKRQHSVYAMNALDDLITMPAIAAEAHLHLGHERFIRRELDLALDHYQQAARLSDDPYVRYLAHFLAGRLFDYRQLPAEAERQYLRALETLPNVQSAATAVASARFLQGKPNEAFDIVESAFSTQPRLPDPWRLFFLGDYRFWPSLIERLHGRLR